MQAGKRCLVFGVASARSIAWGIASNWASQGAHVIVVCQSMRLLPSISSLIAAHPHAQNMIAAPPCDVTIDSDIEKVADFAQHFHKVKRGRALDAIVHSVAFAPSEAMKGRLVDVTSHDFAQALHISSYSLISISKKFTPLLASEPLLDAQGSTQQHNTSTSSITTLSFLGSQRVVPQYSVMGPAKAALEAIARGVAVDLAPSGIRCNVLSPGHYRITFLAQLLFRVTAYLTAHVCDIEREQTSVLEYLDPNVFPKLCL
eukprot:c12941_g1_i5.p1 GENE.c12941_g1_i5~~c12941_g1_i5.p1  ORF type:complete len:270 (+),score=40.23 c12941_g1_i5:35-811(+)